MRSGLVWRDDTLEKYKFTSGNRGSDLAGIEVQILNLDLFNQY